MNEKRLTTIIIFLVLTTIIYFDLMIFHLFFSARILEYTAIMLCFFVVLALPIREADWLFVAIALFLTLVADTFLVLFDGFQLIGTILFCFVQSLYAIRLWHKDQYHFPKMRILRIFLLVFIEVLAYLILREFIDALVIISMFYLSLIAGNIIHSLSLKKEYTIFSIALILFLLCDITVGLSASGDYISIPPDSIIGKILALPVNLAWLFYLPSQVLIVLSVYFKPKKRMNQDSSLSKADNK